MSEIWWNLAGTDRRCDRYGGGHWVHWIQHKLSIREPGPVIPVTASVDDSGLVTLEGYDLLLERWNHRPALIRGALRRSGGVAQWKPHRSLLVVPTGNRVDGARNTFSLADPGRRRECSVIRGTNPDHLIPRTPAPTDVPPLRVAAQYASGRPRYRPRPVVDQVRRVVAGGEVDVVGPQ